MTMTSSYSTNGLNSFFTAYNQKTKAGSKPASADDNSAIASKSTQVFKTPDNTPEAPEQIKNDKALIEELTYLPTLEAIGGKDLSLTPEKIETALKNWDKLAEQFPRLKGKKKAMERFLNQFRDFVLLQNFGGKYGEVSYYDIRNIRDMMQGNRLDSGGMGSSISEAVQKGLSANPNAYSFAPPEAGKRGFQAAGNIIAGAFICDRSLFDEETTFYKNISVLPEKVIGKLSDRFTQYLNDETEKREARYAREDA